MYTVKDRTNYGRVIVQGGNIISMSLENSGLLHIQIFHIGVATNNKRLTCIRSSQKDVCKEVLKYHFMYRVFRLGLNIVKIVQASHSDKACTPTSEIQLQSVNLLRSGGECCVP